MDIRHIGSLATGRWIVIHSFLNPGVFSQAGLADPEPASPEERLGPNSRILAIVPHFRCEPWLPDAIESLLEQTRPPDAIVVVDDGSGDPPIEIVRRYPGVTLLESPENSGPYRASQTVIEATDYDGYFFQDADDWSMPERLELQLRAAAETGAELISCQAYRVIGPTGAVVHNRFALDANRARLSNPLHYSLNHPSSLVSRRLVERVGGYASGVPFGGDSEFQTRAVLAGRAISLPQFLYVMRGREESLTAGRETGLRSERRRQISTQVRTRFLANLERLSRGEPPDLTPLATLPRLAYGHLAGPVLLGRGGGEWP